MNYYDAAKVRKTGLGNLMADKLVSGQGIGASIGGAITQKFKAKLKGIKEKFDPLNIAKFLFFGSKLGTTLFGKATGRSQEDINYFTGRKDPRRYMRGVDSILGTPQQSAPTATPKGSGKTKKILSNIFSFMQKSRVDELEQRETQSTYDQLNANMEDDRHKEVIEVLVEATKAKVKAEKEMKKQAAKREKEMKNRLKEAERKQKETTKTPEVPKPAAAEAVAKPATEAATRVAEKASTGVATAAKVAAVGAVAVGSTNVGAAIAEGESAKASYNAANKGTRGNKIIAVQEKLNLEDMTVEEIMRRQSIKWGSANEKDKLFAVGKYQVIPDTLIDAVAKLKIDKKQKFNGQLQEKIFTEYLLGMKRPAISKYLNSTTDDPVLLKSAVKQLSLEWASIADPDIPGGKTSHYGSGNKASMTVAQASELLRKDREQNMKKSKLTQVTPNTNVSAKVESGSKELKEQRRSDAQQAQTPVVVVAHNNQTIQQKTVVTQAPSADINPMVR